MNVSYKCNLYHKLGKSLTLTLWELTLKKKQKDEGRTNLYGLYCSCGILPRK